MFVILTLIVAVAAFNIISTLVMAVSDKQSDIAVLRTLGASPKSILKICNLYIVKFFNIFLNIIALFKELILL